MDYVKMYFVYKNRIEQLKRELHVANRMMREAEQMLEGTYPTEWLTWTEDNLPR